MKYKKETLAFLSLILFLSLYCVPVVSAEVWLLENFETWNGNSWSSNGVGVYPESTLAAYSGVYGLQVNNSAASQSHIYLDPISEVNSVFRYKVKICVNDISGFTGLTAIIEVYDSSYTYVCGIYLHEDAGTQYWNLCGLESANTTDFVAEEGTWFQFEMVYERAVDGYCYGWITELPDGDPVLCLSDDCDNTYEDAPSKFYVGKDLSSGTAFDLYFDDISFSDVSGRTPEVPEPTITIVAKSEYGNLFLRNTENTYGETTAYFLAFDYGSSYSTVTDTISGSEAVLAFQVDLIDEYGEVTAAMTGGVPVGNITLDETYSGTKLSSYEVSTTIMHVGIQAMQVKIYLSDDGGDWELKGTWLSDALQFAGIESSTWVFVLPCSFNSGSKVVTFTFGDYEHKAYINNLVWTEANEFEQIMGFLLSGNMIEGLFIFPFTYVLHEVFWLILAVGSMLPMYIHHRNAGIVILFFILFGGAGGVMTAFIPPPFVYGGWLFLLLAMGAIFWRVTR
jgi:hypothetical protein